LISIFYKPSSASGWHEFLSTNLNLIPSSLAGVRKSEFNARFYDLIREDGQQRLEYVGLININWQYTAIWFATMILLHG
jgi:hypothetical protein